MFDAVTFRTYDASWGILALTGTHYALIHRSALDEKVRRGRRSLASTRTNFGRLSGNRSHTRVMEADATLTLLLAAEECDGRKTLLAVGSRGLGLVG